MSIRKGRGPAPLCNSGRESVEVGMHHAGCSERLSSKAAASLEARRMLRYVESLSAARTPLVDFFSILLRVATTPVDRVRSSLLDCPVPF